MLSIASESRASLTVEVNRLPTIKTSSEGDSSVANRSHHRSVCHPPSCSPHSPISPIITCPSWVSRASMLMQMSRNPLSAMVKAMKAGFEAAHDHRSCFFEGSRQWSRGEPGPHHLSHTNWIIRNTKTTVNIGWRVALWQAVPCKPSKLEFAGVNELFQSRAHARRLHRTIITDVGWLKSGFVKEEIAEENPC